MRPNGQPLSARERAEQYRAASGQREASTTDGDGFTWNEAAAEISPPCHIPLMGGVLFYNSLTTLLTIAIAATKPWVHSPEVRLGLDVVSILTPLLNCLLLKKQITHHRATQIDNNFYIPVGTCLIFLQFLCAFYFSRPLQLLYALHLSRPFADTVTPTPSPSLGY